MQQVRILQLGESALIVEFGNIISSEVNRKVHRLAAILQQQAPQSFVELVPTYRSLCIYFNPTETARADLEIIVQGILNSDTEYDCVDKTRRIVHIPVCYGGDFGPDLEFVANYNNKTVQEVIDIHTSQPYLIYMLGFTPGFPYLGGMADEIATPRLKIPRTKIPAGSVGIAGNQTGFYPIDSPGGWRLIGRTAVKAFNPTAVDPFLFAAGDYLQFDSINLAEYQQVEYQVAKGTFVPKVEVIDHRGEYL